jgi:hypothetical protein
MKYLSMFFAVILFLFCSIGNSQTGDIYQTSNSIQYIHHDDGSLIEIRTILEWNNNQWENYWKNIYSYDTENKLIEEIDQAWNNNIWQDAFHIIYSYDTNNNLIEQLVQTSTGINFLRYLFTYDTNNYRTEEIRQMWNETEWENDGRVLYTYDINNDLTEKIIQEWDGSEWINNEKYTYSYLVTEVERIEEPVLSYAISNNYPNPFNPSTRIKYFIPKQSFVTIIVFDALGKEVTTIVNEEKQPGIYEITWNAEQLPSGVYFYQLKAGSFIETKKMLLLK